MLWESAAASPAAMPGKASGCAATTDGAITRHTQTHRNRLSIRLSFDDLAPNPRLAQRRMIQ
jgi:hypothetical protein